ncbi:MAG: DUF2442 domain-containing protein [Burkholderiales bacterium]
MVEVRPCPALTLHVRFADGTAGQVRFEESHLIGVFGPLRDPAFFQRVSIHGGAVTWPGDLELAPDAMYDAIKAQGEWVLR